MKIVGWIFFLILALPAQANEPLFEFIGRDALMDQAIYLGHLDVLADPTAEVTEAQVRGHIEKLVKHHGDHFSASDLKWVFENSFAAISEYRDVFRMWAARGEEPPRFLRPPNLPGALGHGEQ